MLQIPQSDWTVTGTSSSYSFTVNTPTSWYLACSNSSAGAYRIAQINIPYDLSNKTKLIMQGTYKLYTTYQFPIYLNGTKIYTSSTATSASSLNVNVTLPDSVKVKDALLRIDLYCYNGHGASYISLTKFEFV